MIRIWGRRNSSNVQKAVWACAELGLPFERRNVGGSFGAGDTAEYRALNPNGLVPTVQDGDLTLWESDAVLRYLARRYGAGVIQPEDEAVVALADQWTTWNTTTYWPSAGPVFFATVRTPRADQKPEALDPALAKMNAALDILDRALEGRAWIAGDRFSFGDMGLAIATNRILQLPHGAPSADDVPNIRRWMTAIRKRPAFREHVDLPIGTCLEEWLENERSGA